MYKEQIKQNPEYKQGTENKIRNKNEQAETGQYQTKANRHRNGNGENYVTN